MELINIFGHYVSPITLCLAAFLVIFLSVVITVQLTQFFAHHHTAKLHAKQNERWSNYILTFVNKHKNDKNTEIINMNELIRSYTFRKKIIHIIPVVLITVIVVGLIFITAPTSETLNGKVAPETHWVKADVTKVADDIVIDLDENLIPVRNIDGDNARDDNFANYAEQKWANAVSVKPEALDKYKNADASAEIDLNDVTAWWVYLPRFKYRVQRLSEDDPAVKPTLFDITLQKDTGNFDLAEQIGDYQTHPIFNYNNGIWVGKFETSGTPDSFSVLPNQKTLTNISYVDLVKQSTTDSFGLADMDATFAGNDVWGAVAIFTTSQYGVGLDKVQPNTNSTIVTGCGPIAENDIDTYYGGINCDKNGQNSSWGTRLGLLASTTHNIYGIYDLAGGADEYANSFSQDALGDATFETMNWQGNASQPLNDKYPFIIRGGAANQGKYAGIFAYGFTDGSSSENYGFRLNLTKKVLSNE